MCLDESGIKSVQDHRPQALVIRTLMKNWHLREESFSARR